MKQQQDKSICVPTIHQCDSRLHFKCADITMPICIQALLTSNTGSGCAGGGRWNHDTWQDLEHNGKWNVKMETWQWDNFISWYAVKQKNVTKEDLYKYIMVIQELLIKTCFKWNMESLSHFDWGYYSNNTFGKRWRFDPGSYEGRCTSITVKHLWKHGISANREQRC